jgi:hypothetical protein
MLVKFDSAAGTITMFGDVAVQLLHMMGHSGTVPSALLARDIPAAIAKLKAALGTVPEAPSGPADEDGRDREPKVSLRQRAHPLIELLERAASRGADVLWDKG